MSFTSLYHLAWTSKILFSLLKSSIKNTRSWAKLLFSLLLLLLKFNYDKVNIFSLASKILTVGKGKY
jgi:hypothetical protein